MSADRRMATMEVPGLPNIKFHHLWKSYRAMNYKVMWRKVGGRKVSHFEILLKRLEAEIEVRKALDWALRIEVPHEN